MILEIYKISLESYRENFSFSGLFLKLSYDKARYFRNVFYYRTLLSSSYFSFYKSTSENVCPYLNYTKAQVNFFLKVAKLWTILSRGFVSTKKHVSVQKPPIYIKIGTQCVHVSIDVND